MTEETVNSNGSSNSSLDGRDIFLVIVIVIFSSAAVISLFGFALYNAADVRISDTTPVEEYEGEYVGVDDLDTQEQGIFFEAIRTGEPVVMNGFELYEEAVLYEGTVYEFERSDNYIYGVTEPEW